jgi:NAD(P)-dependent dehydrogenase (short-subunit alcohol dehydrogenase family)
MSTERKVAVVTGASQGIGAALVKAYRDAGFRVVANSRSIRPASDAEVLAVAGDVADPQVAAQVIQQALDKFGRVDTLINNAGIFTAKPFTEFTEEDWAANISTNLAGFFFITQNAIRAMEKQGSGHIVQITTSLVDQPINGVPAALAAITKGGLKAVTKELAIEYASRGLRVNAVSPGIIKTPMHAPETHDFLSKLHPVGRLGETRDITDAVLYLENAPFVTGTTLYVDGGQAAGHW